MKHKYGIELGGSSEHLDQHDGTHTCEHVAGYRLDGITESGL